jgi:hypothetical protein
MGNAVQRIPNRRAHVAQESRLRHVIFAGIALGIAGALAAARVASLLFGVTPSAPLTLAAIATLMTVVALAACCIPAAGDARRRNRGAAL